MTIISHKRIVRRNPVFQPDAWPDYVPPLLRRIYSNRPMQSTSELEKSLTTLLPFQSLKNIEKACELLYQHLNKQTNIVIIGDFDADGATSTAVAVKALRLFGAKNVSFRVPNRFKYGYGLTPEIVESVRILSPNLIITVDNGISSIDGVYAAKQMGIDVLVTDHHLPGRELPAANVIVNPNQPDDTFPSKSLAGVGVIFYVMLALRTFLRQQNWFKAQNLTEPNMGSLLDLVALGTVADVVPLEHNNRILVDQGIRRIRAGLASPGINALIEVSQRQIESITATDLGFALGPRLNAAGRLEDMSVGINCLLETDKQRARVLAEQLHQLNADRRLIEADMQSQAYDALNQLSIDEHGQLPFGLCLYDAHWHLGVIGILASRVKDRLHRPVIIFADNGNDELKGSARSVPGVHIRDVLDAVATRHSGLLRKFGGHAMAAGLSIAKTDLEIFRGAFDLEVRQYLDSDALHGIVLSDGELDADELSLENAILLRDAEPWGQHFAEPLFDGVFRLQQHRVVGGKHLKMTLQHPALRNPIDAIAFNWISGDEAPQLFKDHDAVRLAYKLDVNNFRSAKLLQLIVEHIEPA